MDKDVDFYNSDEIRYPKSKHNLQCLGPCYQPGTIVVHPISLDYVTDKEVPFCAVKEWEKIDNNTGKITLERTDECYFPTDKKDLSGREFEINILVPYIEFNDDQFLKTIYKIYSFEDAVTFIDQKKMSPIYTRQRVLDCAWKVYGNNIHIIDHRVVEFYIELIKKKWLKQIYKEFNQFVHIEDNKVFLGLPETNKLRYDDESVIRINFLIDRFINYDEIYKFIMRYLKTRTDSMKYSDNIKNELIAYMRNKINLTIS